MCMSVRVRIYINEYISRNKMPKNNQKLTICQKIRHRQSNATTFRKPRLFFFHFFVFFFSSSSPKITTHSPSPGIHHGARRTATLRDPQPPRTRERPRPITHALSTTEGGSLSCRGYQGGLVYGTLSSLRFITIIALR